MVKFTRSAPWGLEYNGGSFVLGVSIAMVTNGDMSWWAALAFPFLLIKSPWRVSWEWSYRSGSSREDKTDG